MNPHAELTKRLRDTASRGVSAMTEPNQARVLRAMLEEGLPMDSLGSHLAAAEDQIDRLTEQPVLSTTSAPFAWVSINEITARNSLPMEIDTVTDAACEGVAVARRAHMDGAMNEFKINGEIVSAFISQLSIAALGCGKVRLRMTLDHEPPQVGID